MHINLFLKFQVNRLTMFPAFPNLGPSRCVDLQHSLRTFAIVLDTKYLLTYLLEWPLYFTGHNTYNMPGVYIWLPKTKFPLGNWLIIVWKKMLGLNRPLVWSNMTTLSLGGCLRRECNFCTPRWKTATTTLLYWDYCVGYSDPVKIPTYRLKSCIF